MWEDYAVIEHAILIALHLKWLEVTRATGETGDTTVSLKHFEIYSSVDMSGATHSERYSPRRRMLICTATSS